MRYFLCLFLFCICTFPAVAEAPYKVEKVKISLKGINPVEAREKAIEAGQIKAMKALLRGLNQGNALEFDESRAAAMVENFEITDEQIAPNRYAATYTFNFNRLQTQELLRQAQYASETVMPDQNDGINVNAQQQTGIDGQSYSDLFGNPNAGSIIPLDTNAGAISNAPLLLAYWKAGDSITLWEQDNLWKDTWARLERQIDNDRNAFILPIGDLADMRVTTKALPERPEDIQQLLNRYQTSKIIVALGQRAASSITTTLYKADAEGLIFWKVIDSPMGPTADPYSVAAGQIIAEIRGNSNPHITSRIANIPAEQLPPETVVTPPVQQKPFFTGADANAVTNTIRATSEFNSPKEWLNLKSNLTPENGIQKIRVLSLSPRSATVELHLSAPLPQAQRNLSARSITLNETSGISGYVIRFAG